MRYGRFIFRSELQAEALLPPFKGSTFRGAFGTALKRVVCALKRQECQKCLLADRCIYNVLFENNKAKPSGGKSSPSPLHPFVIEPPLTDKIHFTPGEEFVFHLLLFGPAIEYLPYFIYAFQQMGQIGIGKRVNGKRGRFILKTVSYSFSASSQGKRIYSHEDQRLMKADYSQKIALQEPLPHIDRLTIHFKTPLRVKYENHLKADLPFHILIRAANRRISTLFASYGEGEPVLDYKGMVERAKEVKIKDSSLRWFDWERYSNRQEVKMCMGGMVGSVTYQGNLGEFLPSLRLCEEIHLGKQTTFGLGQIMVESK